MYTARGSGRSGDRATFRNQSSVGENGATELSERELRLLMGLYVDLPIGRDVQRRLIEEEEG